MPWPRPTARCHSPIILRASSYGTTRTARMEFVEALKALVQPNTIGPPQQTPSVVKNGISGVPAPKGARTPDSDEYAARNGGPPSVGRTPHRQTPSGGAVTGSLPLRERTRGRTVRTSNRRPIRRPRSQHHHRHFFRNASGRCQGGCGRDPERVEKPSPNSCPRWAGPPLCVRRGRCYDAGQQHHGQA